MKSHLALLTSLSVALIACESNTLPAWSYSRTSIDTPRTEWIDSAITQEEAIRRFRADLPTVVTQYSGGASSKDALVQKFVAGVANSDTASLAKLAVSRGEFAYLYYPDHPQSKPPYELSPQLMWFQMAANSEKGLRRVLRDFGGQHLPARYTCADSTEIPNGNRIWTRCAVETAPGGQKSVTLFSAIVSRAGVYKFLSYTNNL